MIFAAEPASTSTLLTAITIISGIAAAGGAIVTAFIAAGKFKPERRKTEVEADKIARDTQYSGGDYIKQLSEAAASLVIPLRTENEKLQGRVRELEDTLHTKEDELRKLEAAAREARLALHRERELSTSNQEGFDARLRAVSIEYQRQINQLKAEIARLEAEIAAPS